MRYAEITGWGSYAPPVTLTNDDLAKVIDTSDEWIYSRSGIKRRHISHVSTGDMSWLACERALAAAGIKSEEIDLIILGSTTPEEICPNTASIVKNRLGAINAACFDLNSACTSWFYGLNVATDMIKAGSISKALVIGAERISLALDWHKRESCVLFGDGAGAVVIEASKQKSGLLAAKSGCVSDTRELLHIPDWGLQPGRFEGQIEISLDFQGQEIFKNAVRGMAQACDSVMENQQLGIEDIDLFIPHQANIRIIQTLAKKLDVPMEKVIVRIDEYANTSAASIPLAMCDALSNGVIQPGMTILTATFGAGLTWGAGVIRWGQRAVPLATSDKKLPEFAGTGFDLLEDSFAYHNIDVTHLLTTQ